MKPVNKVLKRAASMLLALVLVATAFPGLTGEVTTKAFVVENWLVAAPVATGYSYDYNTGEKNVSGMRYRADHLGQEVTVDAAWATQTIALGIKNEYGRYTLDEAIEEGGATLTVTKAVSSEGVLTDTGEAVDTDAYSLTALAEDDPRLQHTLFGYYDYNEQKYKYVYFEDMSYYDIWFAEEGDYCLTLSFPEESPAGVDHDKVFITATHPKVGFYKTAEISKESYLPEESEEMNLSRKEGDDFYFICDNNLDNGYNLSGIYLADSKNVNIYSSETARLEMYYPYLDFETEQSDGLYMMHFSGNGKNISDWYDDIRVYTHSEWYESISGKTINDYRIFNTDVFYPLTGLAIQRPGWASPSKELRVPIQTEELEVEISKEGEPFEGTLKMSCVEGEDKDTTSEITVTEGKAAISVNKLGTYKLTEVLPEGAVLAGEPDAITVKVTPEAISFYQYYDELDSKFDGPLFAKAGSEYKSFYIYINPEIKDGPQDMTTFTLSNLNVTGWLQDENGAIGEAVQLSADDVCAEIDDGWYEVSLPGTYEKQTETGTEIVNFDNYSIGVIASKGSWTEEKWMDVFFIQNGTKLLQVVESQDPDLKAGDLTSFIASKLSGEGANEKFKLVSLDFVPGSDEIDVNTIKDFDPTLVKIGYINKADELVEDDGVSFTVDATGVVDAAFSYEGYFNVYYGDVPDGGIGQIGVCQNSLDFYETENRPGFYEPVTYFRKPVTVKEKKSVENDTFYLNWYGWDEENQAEFTALTGNTAPLGSKTLMSLLNSASFGADTEAGHMIVSYLADYVVRYEADSAKLTVKTESGKEVSGEDLDAYIKVTDIKSGDFVTGKKIEVLKDAPEAFTLSASIETVGKAIYDALCKYDENGNVMWDGNHVALKDGVTVSENAMGFLNRFAYSAAPMKQLTISLPVSFIPFDTVTLDKAPEKTEYTTGDKLDLTGLAATGAFADGESVALTADDFTADLTDALKPENKKVVLTYKNNKAFTFEYEIKVSDPPVILPPEPCEVGEEFTDPTAAEKKAVYEVTKSATIDGVAGTVTFTQLEAGSTTTNLVIPDFVTGPDTYKYAVTEVEVKALAENKMIQSIVFGNNIEVIGAKACTKMSALTKVTLGDKVTELGADAFSYNKKLKTFIGGKSLRIIRKFAFYGCSGLKKMDLSKSPLETLEKCCFYGVKAKNFKMNVNYLKKIPNKIFGDQTKKNKFYLYSKSNKVFTKARKDLKKVGMKNCKVFRKKGK